tara:strand:- start:482 stop:622 length:141 start_codon:yes stop_codon:yes gene_type:complete
MLKKIIDGNINLNNFKRINLESEQNKYFSFVDKSDIKNLFRKEIFI